MKEIARHCQEADRRLFRTFINQQKGDCLMHKSTKINGVDVEQMTNTIKAVQEKPVLAKFQYRARNRWIEGSRNQTTIKSFYGAGQEDATRTKPFVLNADEPLILLGEDHGVNPEGYVLTALAACLTTTMVYQAAARGIRIDAASSEIEGDLDLRGFLGLSDDIRKGFQQIRVKFTVESDASAEQLQELCKSSPILDTVANPVPVLVSVQTTKS